MGTAPRPDAASTSEQQTRSQAWAPWASVGLGLLFAGGVTGVVWNRRQRRKRQSEADVSPPEA